MAVLPISSQYKYTGRGPFDAKALVKTYAELLSVDTWMLEGNLVAYNGLITAVWLNKDDTTKNGVYFLYDPLVTTALKKPDVTLAENWHRFAELSDLSALTEQLAAMNEELASVKSRISALELDKVIIRRDNEFNYRQKTPDNNEICLVDVAGYGLRVKIGDGTTAFTALPYLDEAILSNIDSLIVKGYLYQNNFYVDNAHTELLEPLVGRIYIDAVSSRLYVYNGIEYEPQKISLPNATSEVAGVVKLYNQIGQNVDGTMTQKAITDELDDKFEMVVKKDEEMLVFDTDLY